jgi:hypothetical protein
MLFCSVCVFASAVGQDIESTKDNLRIFLLPTPEDYRPSARDFSKGNSWAVLGAPDFLLFHLLDGKEFGRQVPALWVHRSGSNFSLAIIDEGLLFTTEFRNARVEGDDILSFDISDGKGVRSVRMHLLWRPKLGMTFVERRGVEFLGK